MHSFCLKYNYNNIFLFRNFIGSIIIISCSFAHLFLKFLKFGSLYAQCALQFHYQNHSRRKLLKKNICITLLNCEQKRINYVTVSYSVECWYFNSKCHQSFASSKRIRWEKNKTWTKICLTSLLKCIYLFIFCGSPKWSLFVVSRNIAPEWY